MEFLSNLVALSKLRSPMKTRIPLLLLLSFLITTPSQSQTKSDRREMFNQGEMYILFEEYNEALPSFIDLLKLYPDNSHFKYRIGQCYINMPGQKEKAIPYLEDAVKNINPKHKEGRMSEKGAPYDALYYLANAYRINNQLDNAISTYKRFIENMNYNVYDSAIVQFQLQACYNAKQLMSTPLYVKQNNMGGAINDVYSEMTPVVSLSDNILLYSRKERFRTSLLFSNLVDGKWSGPVDIIPDLRVDDKFYPTSISKDGKTLYLYSNFDFVGNIYSSEFNEGAWGPVTKLNDNINTKYWESHATVSPDGKRLFFSSNRKGGYGGLDLYVSEIDSTGGWGVPKNLGPVINTVYHEDTPFMTEDGKTLFFSSRGHFNMGGYDIFYTTELDSGKWSVPLNAGYPLNTTDDDLFFMPIGKGYEGYISKFDDRGFGEQDLFRVEIFSDDHPRKFYIRGITRIEDLNLDVAERIRIIIRDQNDPNTPIIVYADPETGKYEFEIKHGDYEITFDADGVVKEVKKLSLPLTHVGDSITMPLVLFAKMDFEAELTILSDTIIKSTTGDTLEIKLLAEPRSTLDIKVTNAGQVLSSKRYIISEPAFSFKFVPETGKNIVDFLLTDMFSNTTSARVIVERSLPPVRETVTRPEYQRIIAANQVKAFLEILKREADDDLKNIIDGINLKKQTFGNIDDVISYISEEAIIRNIDVERVDKLALKTAVNQNILTQAAVDYLERNADGELKSILKDINVYDLKLKSWNDLSEYVTSKSGGRVTGIDLKNLADYLIFGPEKEIALIREKIVIYTQTLDQPAIFNSAVLSADRVKIIKAGDWVKAFTDAAIAGGETPENVSLLFAAISFPPEILTVDAIAQLSKNGESDFAAYLSNFEIKKAKDKDIVGMFSKLFEDNGKEFNELEFYNSLAKTIAENNLSDESINQTAQSDKPRVSKILLPIAALFLFLLILLLRKKKKKEQD